MRVLALLALVCVCVACGDDDSTFTPRPDARPPPDASLHDATLGVACKGADCELGVTCCRELIMPGQPIHYCLPTEPMCDHVAFNCDGPEDCGGDTCCDQADAVRCTTDPCASIVCHKDEHCPAGFSCCDTPVGVVKTCQSAC